MIYGVKVGRLRFAIIIDYLDQKKVKTVPGAVWFKRRRRWEFPITPVAVRALADDFPTILDDPLLRAMDAEEFGPDCNLDMRCVIHGAKILVASPFARRQLLMSIPGAIFDHDVKTWTYDATPKNAQMIMALDGMVTGDDVAELATQVDDTADRRGMIIDPETTPQEIPVTKTDAWEHQKRGYHFARAGNSAYLAHGMGAGKSKTTVDIINNDPRPNLKILICCPKYVVDVWPREFRKHGVHNVRVIAPGKGTTGQRAAKFLTALADDSSPVAIVTNYEALRYVAIKNVVTRTEWDYFVCDEIHRVKMPGGKASMICQAVGRRSHFRLGLSGTPFPKSPLDIYAQFRAIDGSVFGTSFARFKARYFQLNDYNEYLGFISEAAELEFNERLYSIMHRVGPEVLDLPEFHDVPLYFELEPEAQRMYNQLESTLTADIAGGEITAANGGVKLLRLRQITGGFCPDEAGTSTPVSRAKLDTLAGLVEDLPSDEPIIVFCKFHADLDAIKAVLDGLGRDVRELSGRRVQGMADGIWSDGDALVAQIDAAREGIDCTRARYAIYYCGDWSLGSYEQSRKRVHRPGQTKTVTYYHLIAAGTVDAYVYDALDRKADVVKYVLETLTEKRRALK